MCLQAAERALLGIMMHQTASCRVDALQQEAANGCINCMCLHALDCVLKTVDRIR